MFSVFLLKLPINIRAIFRVIGRIARQCRARFWLTLFSLIFLWPLWAHTHTHAYPIQWKCSHISKKEKKCAENPSKSSYEDPIEKMVRTWAQHAPGVTFTFLKPLFIVYFSMFFTRRMNFVSSLGKSKISKIFVKFFRPNGRSWLVRSVFSRVGLVSFWEKGERRGREIARPECV